MAIIDRLKQAYKTRWQQWLSRRIPRAKEVILNQRRVFIFLSSYGGMMSLLLLALFAMIKIWPFKLSTVS